VFVGSFGDSKGTLFERFLLKYVKFRAWSYFGIPSRQKTFEWVLKLYAADTSAEVLRLSTRFKIAVMSVPAKIWSGPAGE
jgi:hypothetical protein